MSNSKIALSLGIAASLVACLLALVMFPERAPSASDTDAVALAEELEETGGQLDWLSADDRPAAPVESSSAVLARQEITEIPPEEQSDAALDAIEERFDDIERRLASLEKDPFLGGFSFVESTDPKLRRWGIKALKHVASHDQEARMAIRKLLSDTDAKVRVKAIDALADIEDRDAIPLLRGLLDDPDSKVRRATIEGFVALDAESEGDFIAELLMDADEGVREGAAHALGKLKSQAGTESLIRALGDEEKDVREKAIEALGRTRARDALPALKELYASGREDSFRLLHALRKLGDSGPFDTEVARLSQIARDDSDERARYKAIRKLANHARDEAQAVFRDVLGDASSRVRKVAKKAAKARN